MIKFQTDEATYSRIFLKELSSEARSYENNKKAFIVAGTVVRINKSNDFICSFLLEDFTKAQVVEVFSDKLPLNFVLELGDILEIKGNFVLNKFNEKVIRVLKVRKITLDEEMIHYLEILQAQKQATASGFNEEQTLINDSDIASQTKIQSLPSEDIIKKKMFSIIFSFAMKNYEKYKECQGLLAKSQILSLAELTAIKNKLGDAAIFDKLLEDVLNSLASSELIAFAKKDIVLNLDFFENFDDQFMYLLGNDPTREYSYRQLYIFFNEMIHDNHQNMINKECVYEYINKLIFRKKLVTVENKKETFRKL